MNRETATLLVFTKHSLAAASMADCSVVAIILCWKSGWNCGFREGLGKLECGVKNQKILQSLSESEKAKIEWAKVKYKGMSMVIA